MSPAIVSNIKFTRVHEKDGLIGLCSFIYRNECYVGKVWVFTHKQPGKPRYRLSYTNNSTPGQSYFHPIKKQIQKQIEAEVSGYLSGLDILQDCDKKGADNA